MTIERALAAAPSCPSSVQGKSFTFLQISDTHVGFSKPANPDPVGTLRETIAKVKALAVQPDFIVHTGDVTHLAAPEQFDMAKQVLGELNIPRILCPGSMTWWMETTPPLSGTFRKRRDTRRLVQLRRRWRAFRRPGQFSAAWRHGAGHARC